MGPKPAGSQSADMFRQRLDELVNLKHPLAQLATHIDWGVFEREWAGHFPSSRGRPATSTRLIAGLLSLQHTFALSDEDVVWGWVETRIGSCSAARPGYSTGHRSIPVR